MNKSNRLLSDIVAYRTYAKHIQHLGRRESLDETINRNMNMHLDKYPKLSHDIMKAYQRVHNLQVMPSMRALQFSGEPILKNNVRQYNCSFANLDDPKVFSEALYLLLSGVGFGFSVQKKHVSKLPKVTVPKERGFFVIHDSIMGWAQSLELLMSAYFHGSILPEYDFGNIRPKGSYLVTTGAKAPGPEPLKKMLQQVEDLLKKAIGRQLKSIECHDLICIISDAVLAGGIRRAALISLFDRNDNDLLTCKHGEWWNTAPWRARANNSAVLPRDKVSQEEFYHIYNMCQKSGSGEPGFYWTDNEDWGTNPCCFTGDTQLLTTNGYKTFGELKNSVFEALNLNGEKCQATVWSTGIKDIVIIKLSNGETITCTPDHTFMLNDGTAEVALNLKGKRVKPFFVTNNINDEYVKLGFIQGDGALTRLNSSSHKGIEVNIGYNDIEIANLFNVKYEPDVKSYYLTGYNDILKDLKFSAETLITRKFPETFDNWNSNQKLSFLRGMYSANGCVIKSTRVSYKAVSFDLISKLSIVLSEFGIDNYITTNKSKPVQFNNGTYICKQSYDLNISSFDSIKRFSQKIGFVHQYKTEKLKNLINQNSPIVLSVKNFGKQEVFDFNLKDETHWGVIGSGFIAHNCEIALQTNQFCNLTTINQTGIVDEKDFMNRVYAASLIGTLQASYTEFDYLRPCWKTTTEKEALLGVSFTGIADGIGNPLITGDLLQKGAKFSLEINERYAKKLGINPAARVTAIKPEGTSSCVLGSSSGVHARHSDYYLRRVRMNSDDALAVYLKKVMPDLVEPDLFSSSGVVVTIPQESPGGSMTRHQETAESLLNRTLFYRKNWIEPAHRSGDNHHNVSVTISVKEDEWDRLKELLWTNRDNYSGISLLPFDGGTYQQAPFEDCSKEKYEEMSIMVKDIDLKNIKEEYDTTKRAEVVACGGGNCEVN